VTLFEYLERMRRNWGITVTDMCHVLHTSRSCYYNWKDRSTEISPKLFVYIDLAFLIDSLPDSVRRTWIEERKHAIRGVFDAR
jgi:hypothetical protein